jgi:hypothetical protein
MDEALKRIDAARQAQSAALDLSDLHLSSLPESLWQLTALRRLDLDNNQLAAVGVNPNHGLTRMALR